MTTLLAVRLVAILREFRTYRLISFYSTVIALLASIESSKDRMGPKVYLIRSKTLMSSS